MSLAFIIHLMFLTQDNTINERLREIVDAVASQRMPEDEGNASAVAAVCRHVDALEEANALSIEQGIENVCVKDHYCWNTNLSRLVRAQVSKYVGRALFCDRCLCRFWNGYELDAHRVYYERSNEYLIDMTVKGENDIVKFENHKFQLMCPFVIYADSEALLKTPT